MFPKIIYSKSTKISEIFKKKKKMFGKQNVVFTLDHSAVRIFILLLANQEEKQVDLSTKPGECTLHFTVLSVSLDVK